jgi:hypothetical protein
VLKFAQLGFSIVLGGALAGVEYAFEWLVQICWLPTFKDIDGDLLGAMNQ